MAQLIVRNLDEEIVTRLRQRAAKHRRSTEAEHREILREVLLPPRSRSSLKEHLLAMPDAGTDRDFERPPDRPRKSHAEPRDTGTPGEISPWRASDCSSRHG